MRSRLSGHSPRLLPILLPLALLPGCGGASPAGTPMSTHMGMVGSDASMLAAAAAEHKQAVSAVKAVADLATLESQYSVTANALCTDMSGMCVTMKGQCMNAKGEMASTQPMADLADQMKQECANHRATMSGVVDLTAAAAEEARHQDALAALRAKLQAQLDAWKTSAADYDCTATGHNHGN